MNNIQENDHGKNIVDIGAFQDRNQSTAWFLRGFQFENLIVSSHFCSKEGVFLLHWYWRQPHLEKTFSSSTYSQSLYQSHLKPSPRFAKLVSEKVSPRATLSRVTRLYLYPCPFLCLCLCFHFCVCLSKGDRSTRAALFPIFVFVFFLCSCVFLSVFVFVFVFVFIFVFVFQNISPQAALSRAKRLAESASGATS